LREGATRDGKTEGLRGRGGRKIKIRILLNPIINRDELRREQGETKFEK
jgi:hypothetical protein